MKNVVVIGPSRAGKSFLSNYLSIKSLQRRKKNQWASDDKDRVLFRVEGGTESVTKSLGYVRLSAKEFKEIHFTEEDKEIMSIDDDYDILLFDTEGLNTNSEVTPKILVQLLSVLEMASIIIDLSVSNFEDRHRISDIKWTLLLYFYLSNEENHSNYLCVQRGWEPKSENNDEQELIEEEKKNRKKLNALLKRKLGFLIKTEVDVELMPNYSEDYADLYKDTLKRIAKYIYSNGSIVNGEEIAKKFQRNICAIDKKIGFIKTNSIKEICDEFIKDKINEGAMEVKEQIRKEMQDYFATKKIDISKSPEKYNELLSFYLDKAEAKYNSILMIKMFSDKLQNEDIEQNDISDEKDETFISEFSETIKKNKLEIKNHVQKTLSLFREIYQNLQMFNANLANFYKVNPKLISKKPGDIITVKLDNQHSIILKVMEKEEEYEGKKYHLLFPKNFIIKLKTYIKIDHYLFNSVHIDSEPPKITEVDYSVCFKFDPLKLTFNTDNKSGMLFNTTKTSGFWIKTYTIKREWLVFESDNNILKPKDENSHEFIQKGDSQANDGNIYCISIPVEFAT